MPLLIGGLVTIPYRLTLHYVQQELYGAHTQCGVSQVHAARELLSPVVVTLQPLCVFCLLLVRDTLISNCHHSHYLGILINQVQSAKP